MARKVFVSYKYADSQVELLPDPLNRYGTCRDYVDYLMQTIEGIEIYKGEDDGNDLSQFADSTIRTHLKKKIRDSSITVVLISKGMKVPGINQRNQWIPWEVKYSLLTTTVDGRTSHPNGLLAVILPDELGTYNHYFEYSGCPHCNVRTHKTSELFEILKNNMFNKKHPSTQACASPSHSSTFHIDSDHSYAHQIEWEKFIKNPTFYLDKAELIRQNIENYKLQKRVLRP